MSKQREYIDMIQKAREARHLTIAALAKKAKMTPARLSRVLNAQVLLEREEAFHLGVALKFPEAEQERIALLTVYALAKTAAFRKHLQRKLDRINAVRGKFSWTEYITSTFRDK